MFTAHIYIYIYIYTHTHTLNFDVHINFAYIILHLCTSVSLSQVKSPWHSGWCASLPLYTSKVGDLSRGWPKGSCFNSYHTEALLHSLDCSTTLDLCLIMLNVKQGSIKYHFSESLVWLNLGLNLDLPDHWRSEFKFTFGQKPSEKLWILLPTPSPAMG